MVISSKHQSDILISSFFLPSPSLLQGDRLNFYQCEFQRIDEDGKLEFDGLRENLAKPVSII